jgi:hypothetical protein
MLWVGCKLGSVKPLTKLWTLGWAIVTLRGVGKCLKQLYVTSGNDHASRGR